jgi:hypothetical protein
MSYSYNGTVDPRGVETDKRARQYSEEHGVSYSDALRHVLREQKNYSAENGPWILPNQANPPAGIVEAFRSCANMAQNAGHDAQQAADFINGAFDGGVISKAAQFVIERRKDQVVSNMSPGKTDINLQRAYAMVQAEMPETWSLYIAGSNARMTAAAAEQMFMQKFFSERAQVRQYSADSHVKYDSAGNQFRTYSYAPAR